MNWTQEQLNEFLKRGGKIQQDNSKKKANKFNVSEFINNQKQSKYKNQKTEVDGIIFDSKKEAMRYRELKQLEFSGHISHLELQKEFILQEGFQKRGKKIQPIKYIADFVYLQEGGDLIIEDVKGKKTKEYLIKKKLFEFKFKDLTITET